MVVDSIKQFVRYFLDRKELTEPNQITMNSIAPIENSPSDAQDLYTFVENCLKDNVSAFALEMMRYFICLFTQFRFP